MAKANKKPIEISFPGTACFSVDEGSVCIGDLGLPAGQGRDR